MFRSICKVLLLTILPYSFTLFSVEKYLVYEDLWSENDIYDFQKYDWVILSQESFSGTHCQKTVMQIKEGPRNTKVFFLLRLGEDDSTFDGAPLASGDGRGTSYYDWETQSIHYQNKGVASYYLDEWTHNSDGSTSDFLPDGISDRNEHWQSAYVNPGDPNWQEFILLRGAELIENGADGFVLDALEVGNPWNGYGWTARGLTTLIEKLDSYFPEQAIGLRNGEYFFVADFPYQFEWRPTEFIDFLLLDGKFLDSNYIFENATQPGEFNLNSQSSVFENVYLPKIQAELNRDKEIPILTLDYASDPENFLNYYPTQRENLLNSTSKKGTKLQISNRYLNQYVNINTSAYLTKDVYAPAWTNTSIGFEKSIAAGVQESFMAQGYEHSSESLLGQNVEPNIGVQKVIPKNQAVLVQWDAAIDQNGPIRYNIYWMQGDKMDFERANLIADVTPDVPDRFTNRTFSNLDSSKYPYQFKVDGLENGVEYCFAVRAEDSSPFASDSGQIGPNGGIEDKNTKTLNTIPYYPNAFKIEIDGDFNDWSQHIENLGNEAGDFPYPESDIAAITAIKKKGLLHFLIQFSGPRNGSPFHILLDTDVNPDTGFQGADFRVSNDILFQYQGTNNSWDWSEIQDLSQSKAYAENANFIELSIDPETIKLPKNFNSISFRAYTGYGAMDHYPNNATITLFKDLYLEVEEPIIDGNFEDWIEDSLIATDPIDEIEPHFDIKSLKAVSSQEAVYFHIEYAAEPENLPFILIDSDNNRSTGYYGADYAIEQGIIFKNIDNTWSWRESDGVIQAAIDGNSMELRIEKERIALDGAEDTIHLFLQSSSDKSEESDYFPDFGISAIPCLRTTIPIEGLSNPVDFYSMIVDGEDNEWQHLYFYDQAPIDSDNADWKTCSISHDEDFLYFLMTFHHRIEENEMSAITLYLDIDRDESTGFSKKDLNIGSEYKIHDGWLWEFSGLTTTEDTWSPKVPISSVIHEHNIEFFLPQSEINNPYNFDLLFHLEGQNPDYYPNPSKRNRFFTYRIDNW